MITIRGEDVLILRKWIVCHLPVLLKTEFYILLIFIQHTDLYIGIRKSVLIPEQRKFPQMPFGPLEKDMTL